MTELQDGEDAMPPREDLAGGAADSALPERRCIVTRQALEKDQLIRFVLGPDNADQDFLSLPTGSYVTVGFTDEHG